MNINPACGFVPHAEIVSHELNKYKYMKKMYNNPKTEVLPVDTERMMSDLNVSINSGNNSGSGGHPTAGAPQRVAPAVPGEGL